MYILVYLTAQKNGRETQASGIGWELFENYLIAKEKFKPDYFLYENNKSAAEPIKAQIRKELGVYDGTLFTPYSDVRFTEINSALVSAQNRQRFYVTNFGDIEQPEDRGILLRDILESGTEGIYLTATYDGACAFNTLERGQRTMVAEPVNVTAEGKAHTIKAQYYKSGEANFLTNNGFDSTAVAEPVRIGTIENDAKNKEADSQQYRVYSADGKSVTLCGNGGGVGAKTGLYACPVNEPIRIGTIENGAAFQESNYEIIDGTELIVTDTKIRQGDELGTRQGKYVYLDGAKANTLTSGQTHNEKVIVPLSGETESRLSKPPRTIYEVRNGLITIKDKKYPIKLCDGYYIIRKLTVTECCRLQTLPDDFVRAVSASQGYRVLGNGWTAEVIIHLLNHANIPLDEEIVVLSMYDGIGTGRYCLDKMGYKNVKYHAYEIDKYAMQVANSNYPDIIQHGDAFQVRESNWRV